MPAYVASLWIVGVASLLASLVGKPVKLGGHEIPAIRNTAGRLVVGVVGVSTLVLALSLQSSPTPAPPPQSSPTPAQPGTTQTPPPPTITAATPTPTPTPTTESASPPVTLPALGPVRVRWHGTVQLDDGMDNGRPVLSWSLDSMPPSPTLSSDLGLTCSLTCEPNQIASNAIVAWTDATPPTQPQCVDLLNTHLGQRMLDIEVGAMACLGTRDGRVVFLTMVSRPGPGQMLFDVTVWERR